MCVCVNTCVWLIPYRMCMQSDVCMYMCVLTSSYRIVNLCVWPSPLLDYVLRVCVCVSIARYNHNDEKGLRLDPCYVEPMGMPVHIVALRLLHRLRNTLSVEFLPVFHPTQTEIEKPELFATRVRAAMSKALGVPMVDASFTDTALMFQARKLRLPLDAGYIEAEKVLRDWGLGMRQCKAALQVFASFCAPRSSGTSENAIHVSTMIESLQLDEGDKDRVEKALMRISKDQPVTFRKFLAAVPMLVEASSRSGGGDASSPEDIKLGCVQYIRLNQ